MPTTVRLPPDIEGRLNRLAASTGRPKSFYLRKLITSGLGRLEWEYLVAQKATGIRAGRRETMPNADVKAGLGLDG